MFIVIVYGHVIREWLPTGRRSVGDQTDWTLVTKQSLTSPRPPSSKQNLLWPNRPCDLCNLSAPALRSPCNPFVTAPNNGRKEVSDKLLATCDRDLRRRYVLARSPTDGLSTHHALIKKEHTKMLQPSIVPFHNYFPLAVSSPNNVY